MPIKVDLSSYTVLVHIYLLSLGDKRHISYCPHCSPQLGVRMDVGIEECMAQEGY